MKKKNIMKRKDAEKLYDNIAATVGALIIMGFFYYFLLAWFKFI